MKFKRSKILQFLIWLSIAILSAVWIIYSTIMGMNFNPTYFFVFILGFLSFVMALFSIKKGVKEVKRKVNEEMIKQENVKDFLLYQQLLNPPEMNN